MAGEFLFPLEFFVAATPLSLGASSDSRQRWKILLQQYARERIAQTTEFTWLDDRPLALSIHFFPAEPMEGDIDNIIKPIMDALVGVAYSNDRVVERVVAQKFEPETDWVISDPSEVLALALDISPPVVYIRVDDDIEWRQA